MSRRKKNRPKATAAAQPTPNDPEALAEEYRQACRQAESGSYTEARQRLERLAMAEKEPRQQALLRNDLATLAAVAEDLAGARAGFHAALALDESCDLARTNLIVLGLEPNPMKGETAAVRPPSLQHSGNQPEKDQSIIKVALVSFLFNWPSTGGGNIHTVELAGFLARAGYEVKHFYFRFPPWGIGQVEPTPYPSEGLAFTQSIWSLPLIQARLRQAVDAFRPDWVIITDAWNVKPHLAEAVRGYRTILRFQALECLCPLNNVRLLTSTEGEFGQCPLDQLASPLGCFRCLQTRGRQSGGLHQAERELAGVGTRAYLELLQRALREAEAVLVLNPEAEALLRPHARQVRVVTWGMDPARFPALSDTSEPPRRRLRIFQAAVVSEFMKGFHVLHAAARQLWAKRQDFELVATGEPVGAVDTCTRFTGWAGQAELPALYREADIVVVPTLAQEGLSRTSVEAMAAGRPVVASRIGGLPFSVTDGVTGFLCEPGNVCELAEKLECLLDDPALARRLGAEGRRQFEERFAWPVVIERDYRPLLGSVRAQL